MLFVAAKLIDLLLTILLFVFVVTPAVPERVLSSWNPENDSLEPLEPLLYLEAFCS